MKVRVKFSKQGSMKFIGHLDLMRYFQKAIRRSKIDICYSAGFNPHQVMSFAAPLGVGITSNGDYMDIEVNTSESSPKMVDRLNTSMAEGMKIISFRRLKEGAKNAMSVVAGADYTLRFRPGYEPEDMAAFFQAFQEFIDQDSILIMKKTKKSEKEVDIRPMILQAAAADSVIFLKLSSGSASNLKPELVMEAFYAQKGMTLTPFTFMVQREEMYAYDEDGKTLIPLEDLGEEIEE